MERKIVIVTGASRGIGNGIATALAAEGFTLVSGGTDNHLMLLDLRSFNLTGKELEHRLDEVHITANKNAVPFDPQSPFIVNVCTASAVHPE